MSLFEYEPPVPVQGTITLRLSEDAYRALYQLVGNASIRTMEEVGATDLEAAALQNLFIDHWESPKLLKERA